MATEKRLIDANALLLEIEEELAHESLFFTTEQNKLIDCGLRIAAGDIRHQPTVDAVEVVHGRWIEKKLDNFRKWELTCSECGWVGISNYDAYDEPFDFNYCPNCGAKMDGGNEDG